LPTGAKGDDVLAEHSIDVMLTAPDLGAVKRFYADGVGLEVLIESDDFVTFRCGGDSRLVITHTNTPSSDQTTKASWRVEDLAAELAELRGRGVEVADYDEPDGGWHRRRRLRSDRMVRRSRRQHHRAAPVQVQGTRLSNDPHEAFGSPPNGTDGPVTTTVTRRVKPGHEPFYDQFLQGIIAAPSSPSSPSWSSPSARCSTSSPSYPGWPSPPLWPSES
jgi:hypothetical protein